MGGFFLDVRQVLQSSLWFNLADFVFPRFLLHSFLLDQFIFSLSSTWFNLGKLYFPRNFKTWDQFLLGSTRFYIHKLGKCLFSKNYYSFTGF